MLRVRTLIIIALLIAVFLAVFFILGYLSLKKSVPPESGVQTLSGLEKPVRIGRDEWGVPHIRAGGEADLYFAVGYVNAQDRLWQMDLMRRLALGRCAEKLGPQALPVDILARTLDIEKIAGQILERMPTESRRLMQDYADGVNAYLRTSPRLALEFGILRYQPEPWRPEDSIACMRLIAWLLSMGWNVDPFYSELRQSVDSVHCARLLPETITGRGPAVTAAVIPAPAAHLLHEVNDALTGLLNYHPQSAGSNAWAIAGFRSTSGGALLANDTHLLFSAPSIYQIMHWNSPHINAAGVAFPGLPGLVLGRNEHIGWGITNGMVDDIDFIAIESDSADSNYYFFNGQRWPFRDDVVSIEVRGESPHSLRRRWTHLGPVIGDQMPMMTALAHHYCLRWTGLSADDPFTAFEKILLANDWTTFRQAVSGIQCPGENFLFVDDAGHIGYQLAAAIPLRTLPADSFNQMDWSGFLPFVDLPSSYQPLSGFLASANQCMVDSSYGHYLSAYWESDYRYQRIHALFDTCKKISPEQCRSAQLDVYSGHAAFFVPYLIHSLDSLNFAPQTPAAYGRELLRSWNYQEQTGSVAAAIYERTYLELMRMVFQDEMGEELFKRFLAMPHTNMRALDHLLARRDALWFDDIRTAGTIETIDSQLISAYAKAMDGMIAQRGENIGMWTWGDLHTLTFPHLFGQYRTLGHFFNIGPFPCEGGNFTLNNSSYSLTAPFAAIIGPIVRQVIDMSGSKYQVIITTGQSGHPLSPHYSDQTSMWQNGQMITLDLAASPRNEGGWKWQVLQPGIEEP